MARSNRSKPLRWASQRSRGTVAADGWTGSSTSGLWRTGSAEDGEVEDGSVRRRRSEGHCDGTRWLDRPDVLAADRPLSEGVPVRVEDLHYDRVLTQAVGDDQRGRGAVAGEGPVGALAPADHRIGVAAYRRGCERHRLLLLGGRGWSPGEDVVEEGIEGRTRYDHPGAQPDERDLPASQCPTHRLRGDADVRGGFGDAQPCRLGHGFASRARRRRVPSRWRVT